MKRAEERRERSSRQMLNGACKYRERRDTKGARKRSGVSGQAGGATGRIGGDVPRSVRRLPRGQEDSARACTLQEKEDRKGVGVGTKGCFNSLLSNVAQQEEEKATPPVRNYLADLRRMRVSEKKRKSVWRDKTQRRITMRRRKRVKLAG